MQGTRVQSMDREDSPGEGNGNPLQYSCLENPMDGGAWWATVHGILILSGAPSGPKHSAQANTAHDPGGQVGS